MARADQLVIIGPDASFFDEHTKNDLGQLITYLLYHEIDKASKILLKMSIDDRLVLSKIGIKLNKLSDVCAKEGQ